MQSYEDVCEAAAREGGRVLLDWFGKINAREKAPKDLVTEADLASQDAIRRLLSDAFPKHDFLGEEDTEATVATGSAFRWIVDPLDGTTNYVHRFPGFSVSVALEHDGVVEVGTVFDPISGECFTAAAGRGAFLNGDRLAVSNCERLSEALVAASFSTAVDRNSIEVTSFLAVLVEAQAMRRLGSAALNLAYLAAGRLDAYWATSVKTWDVAAGLLLVREAGGIVTGVTGGDFQLSEPAFAAAATEPLHRQMLDCIGRAVTD